MEIEEQFVFESSFINEQKTEQVTPRSHSSSFLTSSINRPGFSQDTRQLTVKEIHAEFVQQNRPQIWKVHVPTNEVKSACVSVSVNCNMSAKTSRKAGETVAK